MVKLRTTHMNFMHHLLQHLKGLPKQHVLFPASSYPHQHKTFLKCKLGNQSNHKEMCHRLREPLSHGALRSSKQFQSL